MGKRNIESPVTRASCPCERLPHGQDARVTFKPEVRSNAERTVKRTGEKMALFTGTSSENGNGNGNGAAVASGFDAALESPVFKNVAGMPPLPSLGAQSDRQAYLTQL